MSLTTSATPARVRPPLRRAGSSRPRGSRPTSETAARLLLVGCVGFLALLVQTTVLPHAAWHGVVPNLMLLVAVAVGLARGAQAGLVAGFALGVVLDLAPPADHVAGRWALALLVAGYVAGRVRQDAATPGVLGTLATVAGCSFAASSVFALSGLVLHDPGVPAAGLVPDLLGVVLVGVVCDLVAAPFLLSVLLWLLGEHVTDGPALRVGGRRP
ncbi:hypothetical protein GCM10023340_37810 [Nocardioides marinquilinus]|uniref:Rod shape-determining protein MreD n=1 Tax=Nocardioides marinquilinus TaxID=1210400 RepID=A0ABP9PZA9_9ACTN